MGDFIKNFDDVVGHKYIKSFLQKKIQSGNVPKVILFNGNAGIGKTTIAKLTAVAINGNKEEHVKAVIDNNISTDCIKLFNMAEIGEDTETLVNEMKSVSFSSTGKKVIIIDEVHCMKDKAQDAILSSLEYLPSSIYVFLCTTEVSMLSKPLLSRCVVLQLHNLTENEAKEVISIRIQQKGLRFAIPVSKAVALISLISGNQPRMANKILDSFEDGSLVTNEDLSIFVDTNEMLYAVQVATYLYASLTLGINFIDSLAINDVFLQMLVEVLKVGLGSDSMFADRTLSTRINELFAKYDITNFLNFVVSVNKYTHISKRNFIANFIDNHFSAIKEELPSHDVEEVKMADMSTIGYNAVDSLREQANNHSNKLDDFDMGIEKLFSNSSIAEEF